MNSDALRNLIKECVRECLHELLAEKYIESIVDRRQPVQADAQPNRQGLREDILRKMDLDPHDPMSGLFEDTMKSNNQIISSDYGTTRAPSINEGVEHVNERTMKSLGIFDTDWSKYI